MNTLRSLASASTALLAPVLALASCGPASDDALAVASSEVTTVTVPLFQLYHPSIQDHAYTTSPSERDAALAAGYRQLPTEAHLAPAQIEGTVALHRYYKPNDDHFYTVIPASASMRNLLAVFGYRYEGVTGYVAAQQLPGTSPLYRMYSQARGDHLYTPSEAHKREATEAGYRFERIEGYVMTSPLVVDDGTTTPTEPSDTEPEPPTDGSGRAVGANDFRGKGCFWLEASTATADTDYGLNQPVVMALRGHTPGAFNLRTLHPWYAPFTSPMSESQVRSWARNVLADPNVDGVALDHEGWTLGLGARILAVLYEEANRAEKVFCDVPKMTLDPGGVTMAGTTTFEEQVRLIQRYTHCVAPWSYGLKASGYLTWVNRWRAAGYSKPIMPMGDAGNRPHYGGITREDAVDTVHALANAGLSFCLFAPHYDNGQVTSAMRQRYP